MFYVLVVLSCVAFAWHLVLLDRVQKFRVRPSRWSWWGPSDGFYGPELYQPEARGRLRWVRWSATAWLTLVGLAAVVLRAGRGR